MATHKTGKHKKREKDYEARILTKLSQQQGSTNEKPKRTNTDNLRNS